MARRSPGTLLLRAALIFFIALGTFRPALHGTWLWDDDRLISENHTIQSSDGLWTIWLHPASQPDFFPLTVTANWIEWHLWGNSPTAFHVVSLLLHIISALLVWRLLHKLGLRWAWLGGLFFAIHPVVVESVAWIAELKNTLSLPLVLLAMIFWIDFDERHRPRDYAAALAFFVLAMLAKTTMAMLPLVILLYAWYRRGRIGAADLRAGAPFFAVSISLGLVTVLFLNHGMHEVEVPMGGPLSRLACAGLSLAFYFSKCVLPIGLAPIYPRWPVDPPTLAQFLPWPILLAVLFYLWRQRRGWGRPALLGLGFFLLFLLPFSGFIPGTYMRFTWVMDHIVYLPLIGLIGLFVAALESLSARLPPSLRPVLLVLIALVAISFSLASHTYASAYIDRKTYWTFAVRQNPGAWPAHNNLGDEYLKNHRIAQAMDEFNLALQLDPGYYESLSNRGQMRVLLGDSRGLDDLGHAINLEPEIAEPYVHRGAYELSHGDPAAAQRDLGQFRARATHGFMQDYAALWLWIARQQQGDKAAADTALAADLDHHWVSGTQSWVAQDARFLLDRLPEKDYLAAATVADPEKTKDQLCEAWFYIGTKRLLAGDKPGAIAAFQSSIATGRTDFFEYAMSVAQLQR